MSPTGRDRKNGVKVLLIIRFCLGRGLPILDVTGAWPVIFGVRAMFFIGGLLGLMVTGLMMDLGGLMSPSGDDEDDPDITPETDSDLPPILPEEDPPLADVPDSPEIDGSAGADILMGGTGSEVIRGDDGADDLRGGLGDDLIYAGQGDDWVQGDAAYGEGGNDIIHGGPGDDMLAGQGGDDLVYGDAGDDTLFGGEGDDSLFGGAGNDILAGHDGDDVLVSSQGSDDLDGGAGDDVLIGHDGRETVWMNGGEGDDTLMPGAHDFVSGNDGRDSFILRDTGQGLPIIADFDAAQDQVVLHLDAETARDADITLHQDQDGTYLLGVNGHAVGRFLQGGGLTVGDIRVVTTAG